MQKKRLHLLYGNHNMYWRSPAAVRRNLYRFYDTYTDQEADLFPGIKVHEAIRLLHTETAGKFCFFTATRATS